MNGCFIPYCLQVDIISVAEYILVVEKESGTTCTSLSYFAQWSYCCRSQFINFGFVFSMQYSRDLQTISFAEKIAALSSQWVFTALFNHLLQSVISNTIFSGKRLSWCSYKKVRGGGLKGFLLSYNQKSSTIGSIHNLFMCLFCQSDFCVSL